MTPSALASSILFDSGNPAQDPVNVVAADNGTGSVVTFEEDGRPYQAVQSAGGVLDRGKT